MNRPDSDKTITISPVEWAALIRDAEERGAAEALETTAKAVGRPGIGVMTGPDVARWLRARAATIRGEH